MKDFGDFFVQMDLKCNVQKNGKTITLHTVIFCVQKIFFLARHGRAVKVFLFKHIAAHWAFLCEEKISVAAVKVFLFKPPCPPLPLL